MNDGMRDNKRSGLRVESQKNSLPFIWNYPIPEVLVDLKSLKDKTQCEVL